MAMVDVDGSSLPADSQPKLVDLVCGLVAIWRSVCIHKVYCRRHLMQIKLSNMHLIVG